MGRVSRDQAELNRQRILQSAGRLFRDKGSEHVSIHDVMADSGLTPGGFYRHFASKDALVAEVFDKEFDQSTDSWHSIRTNNDIARASPLGGLVRNYFEKRPRNETCPMLAFAASASNYPDSTSAVRYKAGVERLYEQFVQAAQHDSATRAAPDVELLFAAMVGAGFLSRALDSSPLTERLQAAVKSVIGIASAEAVAP